MGFKLISIASTIAFYGCYFLKMFHSNLVEAGELWLL